jgi:hypothetical protein
MALVRELDGVHYTDPVAVAATHKRDGAGALTAMSPCKPGIAGDGRGDPGCCAATACAAATPRLASSSVSDTDDDAV